MSLLDRLIWGGEPEKAETFPGTSSPSSPGTPDLRLVIEPVTAVPAPAGPSARMSYAFPWPDKLPNLGARRIGAFTPCHDCAGRERQARAITIGGHDLPYEVPIGTWTFYGGAPLCLPCARRRATA